MTFIINQGWEIMQKLLFIGLIIWLVCSVSTVEADAAQDRGLGETLYTNGYIYTVDAERSVAQSLLVRGDKIVAVGDAAEVRKLANSNAVHIDLGGKLMLPGLHDAHIHALATVESDSCDLKSVAYSLNDLVPVLQACLAKYQITKGDWLLVSQWNFSEGNQPSEKYPTMRSALDAVSVDHPIMLLGNDGHHGAANSYSFLRANGPAGQSVPINVETLNTTYAAYKEMIAVDKNGEPSGGIHENARVFLRKNVLLDTLRSSGEPEELMPKVAAVLASRGITSILDAAVVPETLAMYKTLEDMGGMTFRMRAAFWTAPLTSHSPEGLKTIPSFIQEITAVRKQYEDSKYIRADGVKLFTDAVLEGDPYAAPPTLPIAAVLNGFKQPKFAVNDATGAVDVVGYVDPDGAVCQSATNISSEEFIAVHGYSAVQCKKAFGGLEHSEEYIKAFVTATTEAGFNVHAHALSDKGIRVAVDAMAAAKETADKQSLTQSLAHLQLVHPTEQKRIGKLGIYNTFTYVWAEPSVEYDMTVTPFIDQVNGVEDLYNPNHYYMQNVYPAQSIQKFGGILTAGSDAPVGSRDPMPFANIEQAVTRANEGRIYNADERISVEDAIAAYTINGASMLGISDITGSLEAGKAADLIILDQNILSLAKQGQAEDISETKVLMTVFDGQIVYNVMSVH